MPTSHNEVKGYKENSRVGMLGLMGSKPRML